MMVTGQSMVSISAGQRPSCAQQTSLFLHGHGRAAFPLLILLSVIPNSGPPTLYFWRYKRPPFNPRTTHTCANFQIWFPLLNSCSIAKSPSQVFHSCNQCFDLDLSNFKLFFFFLFFYFLFFYLPSFWLTFYYCLIVFFLFFGGVGGGGGGGGGRGVDLAVRSGVADVYYFSCSLKG